MKAPCKKLFHVYSLWQEIIFTVVNGLTQNQSLTFSKLKLKKKEKIENINALVENKMYKHDNKWCYLHELNV
jgi:hypothetical protein